MRSKLLIRLAGATALAAACAGAAGATPPSLVAKRAQARHVLAQIAVIDEKLNGVVEDYDGARVKLNTLRGRLEAERASLAQAKTHYHQAQQREARLLVWLYTSNRPSAIEVLLGAHSLTDLINLSGAEDTISRETTEVAAAAGDARAQLARSVQRLETDRVAAEQAVHELSTRRAQIERGLAERKRLLASVQAQVAQMEAAERARQARLAAEARARLAAEAAARVLAAAQQAAREQAAAAQARAAAAAQAKAAAAAQARAAAAAAATTTTVAATTTAAATTVASTTTATTAAAATTVAASTATAAVPALTPSLTAGAAIAPSVPLPPGHPQAAQIALQYIGVPYLWAGATPSGFDCSGLVTYVYAQLGIQLPHFAAAQYALGVPVPESQLQPGDLVFFDGLNHVGIAIGNGLFVDAPYTGSYVRIESLGDSWYSSHYVGAKRL